MMTLVGPANCPAIWDIPHGTEVASWLGQPEVLDTSPDNTKCYKTNLNEHLKHS